MVWREPVLKVPPVKAYLPELHWLVISLLKCHLTKLICLLPKTPGLLSH
jgi:hypothetical protein